MQIHIKNPGAAVGPAGGGAGIPGATLTWSINIFRLWAIASANTSEKSDTFSPVKFLAINNPSIIGFNCPLVGDGIK